MTCAGHADGTGQVRCSQCNVVGCAGCLELVHGHYLCTDCLVATLDRSQLDAEEQSAAIELHTAASEAKRRTRRNWILTGVGSLFVFPGTFGMVLSEPGVPAVLKPIAAPVCAIACCYLLWAALWGIPAVWRWWKGLFRGASLIVFSTPFGWLLMTVGFFIIPLYFGYMYGVFGGAIHEYRKNRRITATAL